MFENYFCPSEQKEIQKNKTKKNRIETNFFVTTENRFTNRWINNDIKH